MNSVDVVNISALICLICFILWWLMPELKIALKPKEFPEYKQYETAKSIDERWSNEALIGECNVCGCDDCPIVIGGSDGFGISLSGPKCKWCAERDNLIYHLSTNGTRRFKK